MYENLTRDRKGWRYLSFRVNAYDFGVDMFHHVLRRHPCRYVCFKCSELLETQLTIFYRAELRSRGTQEISL